MMIQYDFFIPKIKKQPAIQDPNDPQGPASDAATGMLFIIYIFIFIIISKIVFSLSTP